MDSSVSPKDEICFLRVCYHISKAVYLLLEDERNVLQFRAALVSLLFQLSVLPRATILIKIIFKIYARCTIYIVISYYLTLFNLLATYTQGNRGRGYH